MHLMIDISRTLYIGFHLKIINSFFCPTPLKCVKHFLAPLKCIQNFQTCHIGGAGPTGPFGLVLLVQLVPLALLDILVPLDLLDLPVLMKSGAIMVTE